MTNEKLCLKWIDFQNLVQVSFGYLRTDNDFADVTLVTEDGEKFEAGKTRTKLVPGTEVKFFDKTYKGAEYKELSEDSLIHQAVAVWTGERPEHLLKKIQEEEYKKKLEEHRKSFMLYLRGEVFLRAALVRVKCEIAGYLSDNMGIAEHKDENDKKINIFFHTDDVKVFKKDIREYGKPAKQI